MRLIQTVAFAVSSLLALLPVMSSAQTDPARINPVLTGATRGIDNSESAEASARLDIRELKVDVRVASHTASVTLELLIATAQDANQDEARLRLVLPNDAVVTGYALDVEGKMIPGQLLEQPKARNVYQDQVRRGIDPGLAEVSAQNVFSTQIYPVTPDHPRRIRVSFVAPFDPAMGFDLPLASAGKVGSYALNLSIEGYAEQPAVRLAGKAIALRKDGTRWTGAATGQGQPLPGGMTVSGGALERPLTLVRHTNGREFFVIADQSDAASAAPQPGGRLRVYWDRSLSHRDDRREDEVAALTALVEKLGPEGIDLITFASDRPQVVSVADSASLRAALAAVTHRGGTSLAGLDALNLPEARQCVMVFDGQLTIDQSAEFDPDCPLSVLTSSDGANGARLGRMAQRQRGRFVRVQPGKGTEAGAELANGGYSVASVRDEDGRRLRFRALPAPAGAWLLVGEVPRRQRMPSGGTVRVRVSTPGGGIVARSYELAGTPLASDAAGVLWASEQVAELGDDPVRHKDMVELAQKFQVAGPDMAFLVLETPQQYLQADIAPPKDFAREWQEQYREARAEREQDRGDARAERLKFVLERWTTRKEWWGKRFTPRRRRADDQDQQAVGAPPAPAPASAYAPPPAMIVRPEALDDAAAAATDAAAPRELTAGGETDDDNANIVVTGTMVSRPNYASASPVMSVGGEQLQAEVKIDLENLIADRPYIKALDAAPAYQRLAVLAEQEQAYGATPAFYLDTAEWFRAKGDAASASLLLLSALELDNSDDETRQIVAFRLERDGQFDRAVAMAERLAANAGFRPQPKRDLALALIARGKALGQGSADLERAFALLAAVALDVEGVDFGDDYEGLETIALMEANALIPQIEARGGRWELDPRLVGKLDTDARIVIEWTADDADIDLWVDEPNGERVFYSNKISSAGGQISNDMTDGYGPEEYAIRRAPPGEYQVRVNGYDADRLNPNGPGHVLIRLTRNFARSSEQSVLVDVDLAFQQGRDRDTESGKKPIALLKVGP